MTDFMPVKDAGRPQDAAGIGGDPESGTEAAVD